MLDISTRLPLVSYELSFDDDLMTPWEVRRMALNEALNECFDLTLELVTIVDVDVDALLGANLTLTIMRDHQSAPRHVFGIVEQIDDLGSDAREQVLRVIVVPAFALLRQQVDSRIWQDYCVLDILDEVLGPGLRAYGRSHEHGALSRGHAVRDYCVQYRESDLDFVCRLLEEEGIAYAFVHSRAAGHEILTLFDANEHYPHLQADGESIPIIEHNPEQANTESIQAIAWSRRLTSTSVVRRDFDWRRPERLLTFEIDERDARSRSRTLFDHTQRRFIHDDLDTRARDLECAAALGGSRCRGSGNATGLRPGVRFRLSGHERADIDGEYIVTTVHHCGDSEAAAYRNEFECVPAEHEIRPPRRTPPPRIFGPQTAIVTGDQDIHTDAHGRVRVQFHWERRPSYASSASCWIPCAQAWAGAGWGTQFIPRVGMQVVVEFLEGNPDDPLITGCVYDGTRAPPFTLPEAQTHSGWRTRSTPDSEGFNELRFDDASGHEEIYIHGQRDWRIDVRHDKTQSIGNDESNTVAANQTTQVGSSRQAQIGATDSVSVGAAQSISVGGGRSISVGGSQSCSVGGGFSLQNGGSYSHNSAGAVSISGQDSGTMTMATTLKLECGLASIELDKSGTITIKGIDIRLEGETIDIKGEDKLSVFVNRFVSRSLADTVIVGDLIKLNPPEGAVDLPLDGLLCAELEELDEQTEALAAEVERRQKEVAAAKESGDGAQSPANSQAEASHAAESGASDSGQLLSSGPDTLIG